MTEEPIDHGFENVSVPLMGELGRQMHCSWPHVTTTRPGRAFTAKYFLAPLGFLVYYGEEEIS